jgi:hypothetical protein
MRIVLARKYTAKKSVEKKIFIGGWVRCIGPAAWVLGERSALPARDTKRMGPVMIVCSVARRVEPPMVLLSAMGLKLSATVS